MPEKQANEFMELFRAVFPFLTTFLLSIWGGTVSHIQRIRKAKRNFTLGPEYWMDLVICSFAGLLPTWEPEQLQVSKVCTATSSM